MRRRVTRVEQEDTGGHERAPEGGLQRLARLEHERERDDGGDVRKRHLRHYRQRARIVEQALLLQRRQQDRRRPARQQERVDGGMVRSCGARGGDAERHREKRGDHGREAAAPKSREQSRLTERHVHARGEHQHREPDLGQEGRRRFRRVEPAKAADPDHDPGEDLADDHRDERLPPKREQRAGKASQDNQGENAERHADDCVRVEARAA